MSDQNQKCSDKHHSWLEMSDVRPLFQALHCLLLHGCSFVTAYCIITGGIQYCYCNVLSLEAHIVVVYVLLRYATGGNTGIACYFYHSVVCLGVIPSVSRLGSIPIINASGTVTTCIFQSDQFDSSKVHSIIYGYSLSS